MDVRWAGGGVESLAVSRLHLTPYPAWLSRFGPPVPSCGFSRPISSRSSVLLPAPGGNRADGWQLSALASAPVQEAAACTCRCRRRGSGTAAFRQH